MDNASIHAKVIGAPAKGVAGLQDDWWTQVAPDFAKSHGSYLRDIEGREFLDFCGFFSTAPVSYDHKRFRDPDTIRHFGEVGIYRPSISDFWTKEMAEFVEVFREIATPDYLQHYFFVDGGSLAVENALKAAFDWKVRKNLKAGKRVGELDDVNEEKRPLGTRVIHFESAFHGRTGYTLSMTNTNDPRKYKFFPKFDWVRIAPPVVTFDTNGKIRDENKLEQEVARALGDIDRVLKTDADDIAAIIIEPIQCEGGDRHIPVAFFRGLRERADKHDVILIYDEVQTGIGATGRMWAHEYFGDDARPDIIAFAKKAQTAGVIASYKRFSEIEENVFGKKPESYSRLNSTWGGHPVDMMRSQLILEIIRDENLLDNATRIGAEFLEGLCSLCRDFDDLIENPRGRGAMLAIDALTPELQSKIHGTLWNPQEMLTLTCGSRTIRFRPHLDLNAAELEDGMGRLRRALESVREPAKVH